MDQESLWSNFEITGKIEDYLKYKGINAKENVETNVGGIDETFQGEGSSNKGNTI